MASRGHPSYPAKRSIRKYVRLGKAPSPRRGGQSHRQTRPDLDLALLVPAAAPPWYFSPNKAGHPRPTHVHWHAKRLPLCSRVKHFPILISLMAHPRECPRTSATRPRIHKWRHGLKPRRCRLRRRQLLLGLRPRCCRLRRRPLRLLLVLWRRVLKPLRCWLRRRPRLVVSLGGARVAGPANRRARRTRPDPAGMDSRTPSWRLGLEFVLKV